MNTDRDDPQWFEDLENMTLEEAINGVSNWMNETILPIELGTAIAIVNEAAWRYLEVSE